MEFTGAFSLLFLAAMMLLGFYFIYELFSGERITGKLLFTIYFILTFMGISTAAVSFMVFWKGSVAAGISSLIISALAFMAVKKISGDPVEWRSRMRYSVPLVLSLVILEISMGYFYASAFMQHDGNPLVLSVNNPDFAVMMFADAVFFYVLSKKRKSISEIALFTFAVSMAAMPVFYLTFGSSAVLSSTIISASLMAVNIVLLYVIQMSRKDVSMQVLAVALAGSDLVMMAGLSSFSMSGELYTITAAMIISMVTYFFLVTHRFSAGKVRNTFRYSFLLLLLINGAELAMSFGVTTLGVKLGTSMFPAGSAGYAPYLSGLAPGMVHDIDFSNPLWWLFPFSPFTTGKMAFMMGMSVNVPFAYFWSSFMTIMATTMSPFYAIMMGSEMSYLVFERYRKSRNAGVRRWALAIVAGIPLFVVAIPFYTPLYIFGMSGMLFAVVFTAFLVSVAAVLVASALFGRRVQCNLVCMAAHMWTNVYYDQFRPRRNSSFWNYARWFFFSLMILFFSLFILQRAALVPAMKIGMITINPLDFYGMFVLNYIWWFFYFLTPVFGTYSCARQGWCGFGTLAGLFNKFFFKVRAQDASACSDCTTVSCQKSCPTSIPVREDLLRRGYTNRVSCIGCGNCVESCELNNLFITDFRKSGLPHTAHS